MEKRLGKGLEALIPGKTQEAIASERISKLKISSITPNKFQPRKKFADEKLTDLKNSIKEITDWIKQDNSVEVQVSRAEKIMAFITKS